jgi:hypothetical protein
VVAQLDEDRRELAHVVLEEEPAEVGDRAHLPEQGDAGLGVGPNAHVVARQQRREGGLVLGLAYPPESILLGAGDLSAAVSAATELKSRALERHTTLRTAAKRWLSIWRAHVARG